MRSVQNCEIADDIAHILPPMGVSVNQVEILSPVQIIGARGECSGFEMVGVASERG